jgi:hypothetical protein
MNREEIIEEIKKEVAKITGAEVLVMEKDATNLRTMVRELNETQAPEEILGNEVYLYRRNNNQLTIAN